MTRSTPLRGVHESAGVLLSAYGPAEAGIGVVESFGSVESEYASIRKAAGVLDEPQRGLIEARGADAVDFLNRMLTQDLKGLGSYSCRRAFWLNRKGRIDADIVAIGLPGRVLLELDAHAVGRTLESLNGYLFAEDCTLEDATERLHRLSVHGPRSRELMARVSEPSDGPSIESLEAGGCCLVRIAGHEVVVCRQDITGEMGFGLIVPTVGVEAVYREIAWIHDPIDDRTPAADRPINERRLAKRIGWHAFNVARIESGHPMYYLDFGPDSLPGETGVLRDRVSFTKGCYLGQEIVARMDALGHPKQIVRGLDLELPSGSDVASLAGLPVTGSAAVPADDSEDKPVGAATSVTLSPMLGGRPIALAMLKWSHAAPGTNLRLQCINPTSGQHEGWINAKVREHLRFWPTE